MSISYLQWQVRVYYEDTDAGGVVYHARYVAFYERARTEMLREHNFHHHALMRANVAFVMQRVAVEYLSLRAWTIYYN